MSGFEPNYVIETENDGTFMDRIKNNARVLKKILIKKGFYITSFSQKTGTVNVIYGQESFRFESISEGVALLESSISDAEHKKAVMQQFFERAEIVGDNNFIRIFYGKNIRTNRKP